MLLLSPKTGGGWEPGALQDVYNDLPEQLMSPIATDSCLKKLITYFVVEAENSMYLSANAYFGVPTHGPYQTAGLFYQDDQGNAGDKLTVVQSAEIEGDSYDVYLIPETLPAGMNRLMVSTE